MAGSTQATLAVAAPAYAKRKARALIGWLPEQEAVLWISGREMQVAPDFAHVARSQQARQAVAARPAGLDQAGFAAALPIEVQPHVEALRAHNRGAQILAEMGDPRLVDLRRVRAAQPFVHTEDAIKRVQGLTAQDLLAIARLTLPIPPPSPVLPPIGFDPTKNAHIIASANPNLRVIGHFSGPLQTAPTAPVVHGLGFIIEQSESYLSVAGFNGHFFLRDGYHRAYGLLQAGIPHVPALVREYATYEDAKMPAQGLLPYEAFMGDRPPTLADYLDHAVGVDTFAPITTKMIVIQALEVTRLG